jgi:tRNA U34 5-methylaminomethyl-2-thiouridine-forming methyltransferase MnmC
MSLFSKETLSRKTLKDGSFSLVDAQLNETYHNWAGAFSEAMGHYAQPALALLEEAEGSLEHLHLWDVCFGLGYNSFAFIQALLASPLLGKVQSLEIQAVEIDERLAPLWQDVLVQAHFSPLTETFEILQVQTAYGYLLSFQAKEDGLPLPKITMHIHIGDALNILPQWLTQAKPSVDLIFHDAFSPAKVPALWSSDVFKLYASVLNPTHGGVLTYSLARSVKTAVEASGLGWQKLPPLGWKKGAMLITYRDESLCRTGII